MNNLGLIKTTYHNVDSQVLKVNNCFIKNNEEKINDILNDLINQEEYKKHDRFIDEGNNFGFIGVDFFSDKDIMINLCSEYKKYIDNCDKWLNILEMGKYDMSKDLLKDIESVEKGYYLDEYKIKDAKSYRSDIRKIIDICKVKVSLRKDNISILNDLIKSKFISCYFNNIELLKIMELKEMDKEYSVKKDKAIITTFSKASSYDLSKKAFINRADLVESVSDVFLEKTNLKKKLVIEENSSKKYTINYKNVNISIENLKKIDLLKKGLNMINIKSSDDLLELENFYLDSKNTYDKNVIKDMEDIMLAGFKRVVIVVNDKADTKGKNIKDNLFYNPMNSVIKDGEDKSWFNSNIEIVKYLNLLDKKKDINYNDNLNINELDASLFYEILAHGLMLKENSIKYDKNSIIDTSRQQMNIKSSFTVEKVSLTTLVSKLRLLLYLDMSKGFKKNWIQNINDEIEKIRNGRSFILNMFKSQIEVYEKMILDINEGKIDNLVETLKINLIEVNEYLSKSVFIWYDLNWKDINLKFRENKITLSSGLNNKKKNCSPLDYKMSNLINYLFKEDGYSLIVDSFNDKDKIANADFKDKDVKISENKYFGEVVRVLANNDKNDRKILDKTFIYKESGLNIYEAMNEIYMNNLLVENVYKNEVGLDQKFKLNKKNIKGNKVGINKRLYHTSVRTEKIYDIKKCFNTDINRLYSTNNLTDDKTIIDSEKKFLNDVSYFFKELYSMMREETKNGSDLNLLQDKIEKFTLNYEDNLIKDVTLNGKDFGKYSKVITSLNSYLNNFENILEDFSHGYYINGYKELISSLKGSHWKKGNFFLFYFVLEAEVHRKKEALKLKATESSEKLNFKNKKNKTEWIEKNVDRQNTIKTIVSIIISIISKIMMQYYSNDKNASGWGVITQSDLINRLGHALVKRIPENIPDVFFNVDPPLKSDDIEFLKKYYSQKFYRDSDEFKAEIGSTIFDIIMNKDNGLNLLQIDKILTRNMKKNIYISVSDEFLELFAKKLFSPFKLPMIIKPQKWIDNKSSEGGYLNKDFKNFANEYLLHNNLRNSQVSSVGKIQIDTVNFLNHQKFKLNNDMVNFLIKDYYNDSSVLFNGFNKFNSDTINIKNLSRADKNKVLSHNSKTHLYNQILSIAILFKNFIFYIPTFLDFRGRIYTSVNYFSYQAEDMSRSIIEFNKGCELDNNNIVYVLQALANLSGKSKLTLKNKEKWAISIINRLNITKDVLDDKNFKLDNIKFKDEIVKDFNIDFLIKNDCVKDLLLNNDDKFQFLSMLFNLINSLIDKDKLFCTPICFDATCNGFQHISAMFKDIGIAKECNVLGVNQLDGENNKLTENIPKDLYSLVASKVLENIKNMDYDTMKTKFLKIDIKRKLVKKAVMTIPYNVGLENMLKQMINDGFFEERIDSCKKDIKFYIVNNEFCKDGEYVQMSMKELGSFASLLYKSVYNTFPNITTYVNYMKSLANIFSTLDLPIEWTTPVGMTVKMQYRNRISKPVTGFYSKKRIGSVSLPLTKMDSMANRIAFMPNFIHSMDNTNIQLLISKYLLEGKNDSINLFTIHDCFATTPDYMANLNRDIKLAFIMIYFQKDYIKSVHEAFLKQIYIATKEIYIKDNKEPVKIDEIDKFCFDTDTEYLIKKGKKEYIIPALPYSWKHWEKVQPIFEKGIKESTYFIN